MGGGGGGKFRLVPLTVHVQGMCVCVWGGGGKFRLVPLTVHVQGGGVSGGGGSVVGVTRVVPVMLWAGVGNGQHAGVGSQFLSGEVTTR